MPPREETKIIDGLHVVVTQRDCLAQADIWEKLIHLAGPAGIHLGDLTSLSSFMNMDVARLIQAFGALGGQLSGPDGKYIKKELLKTSVVHINGARIQLTEDALRLYVEDVSTLYKIYAFALEVNFKNFISAVRELLSTVQDTQNQEELPSD